MTKSPEKFRECPDGTIICPEWAPPQASTRTCLQKPVWARDIGTCRRAQGEKHIIIDLKQQKVFYYVGTTLVGVSPMSSGKEGYGTPRGTYKIIQKDANYKSGTYGVLRSKSTGAVVNGDYNARAGGAPAGTYFDPAPMPYWMRITGGYGMHVGFVTGYPVSHGCVRLPEDMAKTFFEHTPIGTKVTIR